LFISINALLIKLYTRIVVSTTSDISERNKQ
jgi:hypothetical protein